MNMKVTSEKFVNVTNELMDYVVKEGMTSDVVEDMDERTFKLIQLSMQLTKAVNELTLKTAEMLESIDSKLDKLNMK